MQVLLMQVYTLEVEDGAEAMETKITLDALVRETIASRIQELVEQENVSGEQMERLVRYQGSSIVVLDEDD